MRRLVVPMLFGVIGVAFLVSLGIWQVQRLALKEAKLAAIAAMLGAEAVALPPAVSATGDRYRLVRVAGRFTGEVLYKLDSLRDAGPGRRVIAAFELAGGRRVLVDRGIWPDGVAGAPEVMRGAEVVGNLDWPQEVDRFTPVPDAATGLWFARDVVAMAAALGTEAVMIVARDATGDGTQPVPVDVSTIPNNHWNYAVTWFSLAVAWMGMTVALVWRIRLRDKKAG